MKFHLQSTSLLWLYGATSAFGHISSDRGQLRKTKTDFRQLGVKPDGGGSYTEEEINFFAACLAGLTSDEVVADGIISQTEFAAQVSGYCQDFTVPAFPSFQVDCPQANFASLPVGLQLLFISTICPESDGQDTQLMCLAGLDSLNTRGDEFGYIVTPDRIAIVEMDVDNLCYDLLQHVFPEEPDPSTGPPGPVVTPAPVAPTLEPNQATNAPSVQTDPPDTPLPTQAATPEPSGSASPSASPRPTSMPTSTNPPSGSSSPTDTPTSGPTVMDSDIPTMLPTSAPSTTSQPTVDPLAVSGGAGINEAPTEGNSNNDRSVEGDDRGLGVGGIIGVATAAAACMLCFFLVAGRRRRDDDDDDDEDELEAVEGDESFGSENTPQANSPTAADAMARSAGPGGDTPMDGAAAPSAGGAGRNAVDPSPGRGGPDPPVHMAKFNRSDKVGGSVSPSQVARAIDKGNWDDVYKFASQLAEQEDLSTLSSVGRSSTRRSTSHSTHRSHLSSEDQQRANTLDELLENRDWTGVAVTAALYAGESSSTREASSARKNFLDVLTWTKSSSSAADAATSEEKIMAPPAGKGEPVLGAFTEETRSDRSFSTEDSPRPVPPAGAFDLIGKAGKRSSSALLKLKERLDSAAVAGDWDGVMALSSEVGSNGSANQPTKRADPPSSSDERISDELSLALSRGDWAQVATYANKLKDTPSARISIRSDLSVDTSDSECAKKRTIEKLVRQGKWKGVAIMAGLYVNEQPARNSEQQLVPYVP